MPMMENARSFFDACESGKGWEGCKAWCHDDASFSCQADALADVTTLSAYADWMTEVFGPMPNATCEIRAFAADAERNAVMAFAVFSGAHTGEGGPVPPTGRSAAEDYVYVMAFDDDRIRHMTKIWNDGHAMRALGWA